MMRAFKTAPSPKLARLAIPLVAIAGLGLAGCDDNGGDPKIQIGANPGLPALQQYLMPPIRIAKVAAWGKETPTVPEGLQVHALATGFEHPRQLYVLPNGDVLVVESNGPKAPIHRPKDLITGWVQWLAGAKGKGGNRITLLRDTKGDGIPDVRTVFLDHLNSPFGVALVGNDLYVANTDAIVRYPYQEGQTSITAPGTKLTDLPGGPTDHHWTKALLASPDGSKLYVGVGSNSNITENGIGAEYERAAIWEVDRASGAHRIFASGTRNPTGLAWEPETHKLWAIVNERDEIVPDYALSSHVAPLGVAMYNGTELPANFRGGAFVGEHGSWDRTPLNGYKVVFVPFSNGKPSDPAQDVVTGFLDANNHARGRPVGLAIDRTGGLLIADDVGDTVWRVSSSNPR